MKKETTAKLLMALAMFIFGTLAPFVRNIGVSSGALALYRAVMAATLVGGFLLITRQKLSIRTIKKELLLLLLSGAAMGVNWIALFEAYKYTTVSVATLSYYFAPVIVMAVCPLLFKEKLTGRQLLCFILSTLGLILITGTTGGGTQDLLGIAFGLGAAVLYATVMLLNKFIKGVAGLHRTFIQFLSAILVLIPYVALTDGFDLTGLDGTGWTCLLVVGLLHTGITYCMYFSALKELPGQKVAILSYIDPLVAVLISILFLNEPTIAPQLLGGLLILGSTLWSELPSPHRARSISTDHPKMKQSKIIEFFLTFFVSALVMLGIAVCVTGISVHIVYLYDRYLGFAANGYYASFLHYYYAVGKGNLAASILLGMIPVGIGIFLLRKK